MSQQLRLIAALPEYLSSGLSTHIRWLSTNTTTAPTNILSFSVLFNGLLNTLGMHKCTYIYTYMNKNITFLKLGSERNNKDSYLEIQA